MGDIFGEGIVNIIMFKWFYTFLGYFPRNLL
jgi:hypothetical protein